MSKLNLSLGLYRKMFLIRHVEEKIQQHYLEDEMKTPMHMSMGSEAIAAGVCHALKPDDQICGTYRSHGIYLAKTMETERFFAEMYGKATGTAKGKAGSMHLLAPEDGLICTSAVVATHISVAVGAAYANKLANNGKAVAVFFGDGAVDEGAFWESINLACLMQCPLIFVFEDNGYAVHTPKRQRQGYKSLPEIIRHYDCDVLCSETTDVEEIHQLAGEAVKAIAENHRPCFLALKYYRYLEHVGVFEDFKAGYRPRDEYLKWKERDPLLTQRQKLLKEMCEDDIRRAEATIEKQVLAGWQKAREAPFPDASVLCEDVYA